jgi:hypothetical protein
MTEWLLAAESLSATEKWQIAILALAILAALFAMMAFSAARRGRREGLSRFDAIDLLRREGDAIRGAADSSASVLRQELVLMLSQNHESALKGVGQLSDSLLKQVDAFSARLDAANNTTAMRIDGIGAKLNADIAQMGESAAANREALRNVIEQRLDAAVAAQGEAARALRE